MGEERRIRTLFPSWNADALKWVIVTDVPGTAAVRRRARRVRCGCQSAPPSGGRSARCARRAPGGLVVDPAHAAELTIRREDAADALGLSRVDDERTLVRVIAERHVKTAAPLKFSEFLSLQRRVFSPTLCWCAPT